ncbi:MAG: EAL domain-containing protein [Campylobacterota bacterium]
MKNNEKDNLLQKAKQLTVVFVSKEVQDTKFSWFIKSFFEEVIFFKDGLEALEIVYKQKIPILITYPDIDGIDGFDLIEKARSHNENLITIIYSEEQKSEEFIKSINLGVDGFVTQTCEEKEFLDIIKRSISKTKLTLEHKKIKKDLDVLMQYQDIVNKSTIISKTNKSGVITYVNENFCKITGYTQEELIGRNHNIIRHPDNPKELFKKIWKTILQRKEKWTGIIKNLTKDGKTYYVKTTIEPILDDSGEIIEFISARSNVNTIMSDKKQLIDKIDASNLSILILIEIEEFDVLDKFYNIETITKIEKSFGYNILTNLPTSYVFENVYNIGNGRFALLTDFFAYSKYEQDLSIYLEEFMDNIKNSTFVVNDIEYDFDIVLSYSFGKEHLFEDAKCGLENASKEKKLIKYSNDSSIKEHVEAKKNIEVMKMVKIALDSYKIISYFQPIINNKTKEIEKYESLVRLVDEDNKVLSPFIFLDISKKGSYYTKITHRVLENSFKILDTISTKLSINLSSLDIEKEDTRKKLFELLNEHKQHSNRIIFELLEDENVKDFNLIKLFIKKVKRMGVQIAIDDFGSGYSNFERLLNFEPDILKIDGSLVKNIVHDEYSRNIVETIVNFAKKQNIVTVAEYVENEEIFNILNDLGVDYSQGYYFGKPASLEIEEKIK